MTDGCVNFRRFLVEGRNSIVSSTEEDGEALRSRRWSGGIGRGV